MITDSEYKHFVGTRAKSGDEISATFTPLKANLTHAALGIAGESGELVDAIKKYVMYEKDLDLNNVIEELGDLEFYMEMLRNTLHITRDQTLTHNIEKLSVRYKDGYSDKQAQERADKQGE